MKDVTVELANYLWQRGLIDCDQIKKAVTMIKDFKNAREAPDALEALAVVMDHIDHLEGEDRGQLASKDWHWFNAARKALIRSRVT